MHVQGSAAYIDDMPVPKGTLHVAFALSKVAYGKINEIDGFITGRPTIA